MTPEHIADFAGRWQLSRRIDDAQAGQVLTFDGLCEIAQTKDGGDWLYREEGHMTLPDGGRMAGTRQYLWRQVGQTIAVFFEDGRFFHDFALEPSVSADHWCDPDQYAVSYDFEDWPNWSATWTVKGPRKDYVMATKFAKFLEK
ncbi:DUF6314 family protein [Pseudoprimorskyibacter insulae]|uniref:DUF6314 domain-containing protein n=1 Tax=Pseudoprimorskyibacter insulae TaxID=1695997 RepID=A0A2R8AXU2_9RHOB|nr:DUF6314 family protein [Pseudoprimorskyibacter insulae]SPF80862.1 hypothetical protein PRI8871_02675 [Pseudoprimorskyibacter insulae]